MNNRSNLCFLYPTDVINSKHIDEHFNEESTYMHHCGFTTALISLENIENGIVDISSNAMHDERIVVYRGWMLSEENYITLINTIKKNKFVPLTTVDNYLLSHYLPNWYSQIKDLTSETIIFKLNDNLPQELSNLGWGKYFIKDYVKSLKTSVGSIIESAEDINAVVSEMKKYRGTIEGGLCVRRVEHYKPDTEKRYFVIHNKPHSVRQDENIPTIVYKCAKRIKSQFFSVDIAEREDGQLRVIEIGDGQVSDLVGWSVERFADLWLSI